MITLPPQPRDTETSHRQLREADRDQIVIIIKNFDQISMKVSLQLLGTWGSQTVSRGSEDLSCSDEGPGAGGGWPWPVFRVWLRRFANQNQFMTSHVLVPTLPTHDFWWDKVQRLATVLCSTAARLPAQFYGLRIVVLDYEPFLFSSCPKPYH